jgi:hypothetical protein
MQTDESSTPGVLGSNEGLGVTRTDWECEWVPTEKDRRLYDLAKRYHDETEAYDRTVCSGPLLHGSIQPASTYEAALINRNAHAVLRRIREEAAGHGISTAELWKAIGRHA